MRSSGDWLDRSRSRPWPAEEFGLERMRALLAELGDPQRAFPAIHVVGTNGKSTTTRAIDGAAPRRGAARRRVHLAARDAAGASGSRSTAREADFERARRPRARRPPSGSGATQFEALTAAALAEFAAAGVDVAVVEAGLGGRLDATNVLRAPVVVLTNVALDHTERARRDARGDRRARSSPSSRPGATVVLGEPEWAGARARGRRRAGRRSSGRGNLALAVAAAEAFLGRPVDAPAEARASPGRLERRGEAPLEIWDGAHNLAGGRLAARARSPAARYVVVASILARQGRRRRCCARSPRSATRSSRPPRATRARCPPPSWPRRRRRVLRARRDGRRPRRRARRARALAGPDGAVLVTGSLYLLADLAGLETNAYHAAR